MLEKIIKYYTLLLIVAHDITQNIIENTKKKKKKKKMKHTTRSNFKNKTKNFTIALYLKWFLIFVTKIKPPTHP